MNGKMPLRRNASTRNAKGRRRKRLCRKRKKNGSGRNRQASTPWGYTPWPMESGNNPETLVDKLLSENKKMPEIYMSCGTEDFLLENNREFHRFLESRDVPHEYFESKGTHDMQFWSEYTEKIVKWMFDFQ